MLSITSMGITSISNEQMWLKYLLSALVLAFFGLIIGAVAWKDGEEAAKVLHTNDLERVRIIQTGEDRPLNLIKEYKPWKGFLIGLSACIPLIVCMIIHTFLIIADPTKVGAGAIGGYLYMVFFSFILPDLTITLTAGQYYLALIAVPIFMLFTGIPYIFGARKVQAQYEIIERKQREIYGDRK